jgi:hypothetical protein
LPIQAARGAIGLPETGEQVPILPERLQASHWPSQSWLQHTPSAQKVEIHWLPAVHLPPGFSFAVQTPPAAQ